jgi:hypothetical protein
MTRRKGSRIDESFTPSERNRLWAKTQGYDKIINLDLETEMFINYWLSASRNACKLDWQRAWRVWILKAVGFATYRKPQQSARPSAVDTFLRDIVTDEDYGVTK